MLLKDFKNAVSAGDLSRVLIGVSCLDGTCFVQVTTLDGEQSYLEVVAQRTKRYATFNSVLKELSRSAFYLHSNILKVCVY